MKEDQRQVSATRRMSSLRMLSALLVLCFFSTFVYLYRYELHEKTMFVISSLSTSQNVTGSSLSELSPTPEEISALPKQIQMLSRVTNTSKMRNSTSNRFPSSEPSLKESKQIPMVQGPANTSKSHKGRLMSPKLEKMSMHMLIQNRSLSSKPSSKQSKVQQIPMVVPLVPGLTNTSKPLSKWLSSASVVELEEIYHPPVQDIKMNKFMIPACPKFFTAFVKDPKPVYHLCDKIQLVITARDCKKNILNSGGDFIWTWIKTESLKASQTQEGTITDVGNGTYIARFTLRWTGDVTPVVAVVRTRQEIEYLRQSRDKIPARFCYNGYFKLGDVTEIVPCHITPWMNLTFTKVKINRTRHLCNYTDPSTGSPWFCIKPSRMACSALHYVRGDTEREVLYDHFDSYVAGQGASKKVAFVKNIQPSRIKVVPIKGKSRFSICKNIKTLQPCNNDKLSLSKTNDISASGVYYKNVWTSLQCKNSHFVTERLLLTLQNKYLLFFGDSTVRQWFEYITESLGKGTVSIVQMNATKLGYHARHNISLTFTFHGLPVRGRHYTASTSEYIANRLDALQIGGPNVVIVLTIWAHFTATSLEFYRERLLSIRGSIFRLQKRHSGTRIFIKSANTREKPIATLSNWYAWECDQLMRALLGNVHGITIIDVWSMTIGHYTGFRVHPDKGVVKNEVDMLLSYF